MTTPASKDYNISGVHEVNRWLWAKLRVQFPTEFAPFLTSGSPVNGLVPIIPSQQLPQFTNIAGGAPFMIYNYSIEGGTEIWESRDAIGYVIYDDNEARLRRIHNYMVQLLKRMDWTAADINAFLGPNSEFDFKWIQVTNAAGPQPFESEGGRHGALIMTNCIYTRDMVGDVGALGNGLGMRS